MKRGTWFMIAALVIVMIIGLAGPQMLRPDRALASAQVEAHVPPEPEFDRLLQRDLEAYFSASLTPGRRLTYSLLRRNATQSGADFPKYYAWVEIRSPEARVTSGAVRLSAIEKKRFEVTHFLTAEQIRSEPASPTALFPLTLIASLRAQAAKDLR